MPQSILRQISKFVGIRYGVVIHCPEQRFTNWKRLNMGSDLVESADRQPFGCVLKAHLVMSPLTARFKAEVASITLWCSKDRIHSGRLQKIMHVATKLPPIGQRLNVGSERFLHNLLVEFQRSTCRNFIGPHDYASSIGFPGNFLSFPLSQHGASPLVHFKLCRYLRWLPLTPGTATVCL